MQLTPGTRLGPYEILSPLGAGGMGEVYRARDTRLGREVAVKVLPQHLSSSSEVRARFEREAKTVSSLNHPHICTLFDIGREGDTDYLVMELIEGETLHRRLEKGPLPVHEVLRLGREVAEALARAHRVGVVHRDLKPGNIMLTKTGPKLMDFGLARTTGLAGGAGSGSKGAAITQSPTVAAPLTAEGTIVGTFQYMAPEQLEGKETDARSDLWALGCVLYEMATGQRAFEGQSQASLIAAIMTGEPRAVTDLQPVAPPALEKVIRQCLQKDPEDRMQSARDLMFALELVGDGAPGVAAARGGGATARRSGAWWWTGAAVAILLAGFIVGRTMAPRSIEGSIRVSTLSQGTRDSEPAVSPDGRLIAFSAVRQNGQGLWLMDVATRGEVKLTVDADRLPRFTADGGSILFTRVRDGRPSLWRVPVIGGAPRLLIDGAADADPSPDGARIAYVGSATGSSGEEVRLMVARSDGTEARALWSLGSVVIGSPRWSPDGERIAIVIAGGQNSPNSFVIVNASDGASRQFPAPNGSVLSTVVWDGAGKGVILAEGVGITAIQRGAPGRLFRCDERSGKYRPLGWLENFPATLDILPDGRLVLSSLLVRQNLREVSSSARTLTGGRWLTSGMSMDRQPVYSPDGKWVMFSSNRGGTLDLWEVSVETGEMHRVTDDPEDDWDPEYSPDGRSIIWCSGRSGAFEIWSARRDGTAPRQLSSDGLDAENPSVSPDGRWVYYSSSHPDKVGLWRIPIDGGAGERLLPGATLIPDLSPDGRYLSVICGVGTVATRLGVFDVVEGKELPAPVPLQVALGNVQIGRSRFAPDGKSVVYLHAREDGQGILVRRPLSAWQSDGGASAPLFADATETVESCGFSADGERGVVSGGDWLSGLSIAA
ncbi:MAG TPA: protein kinase, partial [Candidatus Krumholzibacteria bacterium]|nr:protein kinase [Candidatus Krumholzibacteria bacterium]